MSYSSQKQENETKVPMSASIDLRDFHNSLATVEALSNVELGGMSKSEALDTCLKALAAIGYKQGFLDKEKIPKTIPEAASKLESRFGLEFNNSRQQRVIQEAQQTSLDIGEKSLNLEEVSEEEEQEPLAFDPESIFEEIRSLETSGPNDLAALINIAQANGWEDEAIAKELQPFLEEKEVNKENIRDLHGKFTS